MPRLIFLLALATSGLHAQSAASLSGLIQDPQFGALDAAKLTLRDPAKGLLRDLTTDSRGAFVFSALEPSTYTLTFERAGFRSTQLNLTLNAGDQRSVRVTMQVASREETVVITSEAPLVRESPAVATSVDRALIANQPLNGRTFQALINLSPGVVFVPSTLPDQGQFSVNGQRTGTNYFTVDGVGANFGLPFATTPYEGAGGGTPGRRRLARIENLRPQVLQNAAFTRVDTINNGGYADYHSLQMQFTRRFRRGFNILASYTWAKSLDTASDESIPNLQAPLARLSAASDRGPSSFDIRHAFSAAASYEIPAFSTNRTVRALLGGFALDSIVRLRSATPVTIVTGRDPLGLGLTNVARSDLLPNQPLYLYSDTLPGGRRFNYAAFDGATPLAQARQGNLGRGTLRSFNLQQLNLSLSRRFRLTESSGLDFRVDAFNLTNTPNFANPIGILTNTNFGRSTQIGSTSSAGGLNPLFQVGGPRSVSYP